MRKHTVTRLGSRYERGFERLWLLGLDHSSFCAIWLRTVDSNLVDSASSHTLVSKIKPCMCKYKRIYTDETANGSLYQL